MDKPANARARLAQLVVRGATLTLSPHAFPAPRGTYPLADAAWTDDGLYYCILWPPDEFATHVLPVESVEDDGNLNLYDPDGRRLGTLAEMEPDERDLFHWADWVRAGRADAAEFLDRQRQRVFAAGGDEE